MFPANSEIFCNNFFSSGEVRACSLSALSVTFLVIATLSLLFMAPTSLSLAEKLIWPMSSYGVGIGFLAIQILAQSSPKKNRQLQEEPVVIVTEAITPFIKEEIGEEIKEEGFIIDLPSEVKAETIPLVEEFDEESEEIEHLASPIGALKSDQSESLKLERLHLRMKACKRLDGSKKNLGEGSFDWRQFALMNNTFFVKGSSFDRGHQTFNCIRAYLHYLKFLQKEQGKEGAGAFFSIDAMKTVIDETLKTMADAQSILSKYCFSFDGVINGQALEAFCRVVLYQINAQLNSKGYAYFPIAYCGRGESHGHALTCKIVSGEKVMEISFLNLGEGIHAHPELGVTNTRIEIPYSYYPVLIHKANWQEIAIAFLAHVFRFAFDQPSEKTNYRSQDLYDLLAALYGFCPEMISKNSKLFSAKPQHIGDCAEKVARNIVIDFLNFHKALSIKEREKMLLNIQLSSILLAYHDYLAKPQEDHQMLFINACEEFSILLLRAQNLLNQSEFLEAAELIDVMMSRVKARPACHILPSHSLGHQPLSMTFSPVELPQAFDLTHLKGGSKKTHWVVPPFNPITFKDDLKGLIATIKKVQGGFFVHVDRERFLRQLPIPLWGSSQDLWAQVPQGEIKEVISLLWELKNQSSLGFDSASMLVLLTLYVVADKLVRRIDSHPTLQSSAFPFPTWIEPYLTFLFVEDEVRYLEIKRYFEKSLKAAGGKLIAPPKEPPSIGEQIASAFNNLAASVKGFLFLEDEKKVEINDVVQEEYYYSNEAEILFKIGADAYTRGRSSRNFESEIYCFSNWEEVIQETKKNGRYWHSVDDYDFCFLQLCQKYLSLTTNEILSIQEFPELEEILELREYRYGWEKPLSHDRLRELLLLLKNRTLQVGLLTTWIDQHFEKLHLKSTQTIIQHGLFTPGVLRERIARHPKTIQELRDLIKRGLEFYGEALEHAESALFLIQVGIVLESYFAAIAKQPICSRHLLHYQERLQALLIEINPNEGDKEEMIHCKTLSNLRFLATFLQVDSVEGFIEIFSQIFRLHLMRDYYYFRLVADRLCKQLFDQLKKFLNQQGHQKHAKMVEICNGIIQRLIDPCYIGEWKVQWESYASQSEEYILEFDCGQILHAKKGYRLTSFGFEDRVDMNFEQRGLEPESKWWATHASIYSNRSKSEYRQSVYVSLDGSHLFTLEHFKLGSAAWKYIKKGEEGCLRSFVHWSQEAYEDFFFLSQCSGFCAVPVQNEREMRVLAVLHADQTSHVAIDLFSDHMQVARVDEKGEMLPYRLVNLEELDPQHPLYVYTLQLAPFKEVLCFVHETTQEIEELFFSHLELSFKRNERGLESKEFPGYFLVPLHIKALKTFSRSAMILRNSEGKIRVLIPTPRKEMKLLGEAQKKEERSSLVLQIKYFSFDLETKNHPIQPKTLAEHLFLIYTFKVHGDFDEAYRRLIRLRTLSIDSDAIKVLSCFYALNDGTPFSLAFNMKLALFFVDHFHLIKGKEGEMMKFDHQLSGLLRAIVYWHLSYLAAVGEDEVHGIPIEWRLFEEEEERILSFLQRERARLPSKIKLPKILKIRTELMLSASRSAKVDLTAQKLSLAPTPFQKLIPPSQFTFLRLLRKGSNLPFGLQDSRTIAWIDYPNQLPEDYCQRYFAELFEQAKKAKLGLVHPFDFTLLAALRSAKEESRELEFASLLFYVRWFSDSFFSFSLVNCKDDAQKINTFNQILKSVYLMESGGYLSKLEKTLNKITPFQHEQSITLSLPPIPPQSHAPLPSIRPIPFLKKPFLSLRKLLFKAYLEPSSLNDTALFDSQLLSESDQEEMAIIAHFEERRQTLTKQKKKRFDLQTAQLLSVQTKLKEQKEGYQKDIEEGRERILKSVNDPYNAFCGDFTLLQERALRLRENAHQTYTITPEMIFQQAILTNSRQLFADHRPILEQKHIEAILFEVHCYFHFLVLSQMCDEALSLINQLKSHPDDVVKKQALLAILDYKFLLAPEQYPEVAFMKLRTGKLPREEQALVYQWVCEGLEKGENRHFQLPAGGGKTSFLTPLIILRCKRHGYIPFMLSTAAMYGIEKENLNHTLTLLDEELDLLELDFHKDLTLYDLKCLEQQFITILQRRKNLMITPQTYYALRLHYFILATEPTDARVSLLEKILNFMQKKGVLLADEPHRNLNPMTQAVCGLGEFVVLAEKEQEVLFALARPLFGMEKLVCEDGRELSEIAFSKERGQGKPSDEEICLIQRELARFILSRYFTEIPEVDHQALIKYLIDKREKEPICLARLEVGQCHLLRLVHYFLTSLVKQIVTMKTDYDHVHSAMQGEIETPSYYKTPSHAQFQNPYLTFVLTIKGTWYRGLNGSQLQTLLEHTKTQDRNDQVLISGWSQTPMQKKFEEWTGSKLKIREIDLNNGKQREALFAQFKKHPSVVEYHLNTLVFPKVGYPSEQFTSTPAHLVGGFKCCIAFSATPLPKRANPRALKAYYCDEEFETHVLAKAVQPENQKFIFPESIEHFFAHLSEHKESLHHVRHLIDAGGILSHEDNRDVAQKWLDASTLDGVIYFKATESTFEGGISLLLKEGFEVEFSSQMELLSKLQRDKKYGFYFDGSRAESAHVDPEPGMAALLLVGDSLTLSHEIQSIMRERGFLNDEISGQLIWVVLKKLQEKMKRKSKNFSSATINTWCLINEVKSRKQGIVMAAYQEIAFRIECFCLTTDAPLAALRQHLSGFKDQVIPHATWGSQKELQNTDTVLLNYAKTLYERFNFSITFDENEGLKKKIQKIIRSASKQIAQIVVDFQHSAVSQMHQKSVVKKQVRIVQYQHNLTGLSGEQILHHATIANPDYPNQRKEHAQLVQTIFNTPHFTDHFYMERNQIETVHQNGVSLSKKFLKSIDFLLIVIHGDQIWAEAIANDVLPFYEKALVEAKNPKINHQAFIIRSDGGLYQLGLGVLKPDEERLQKILQSEWCGDLLIDLALLKGKILYNERFKERIVAWPDFFVFWKEILKAQASSQEISMDTIFSYLSFLLKKNITI